MEYSGSFGTYQLSSQPMKEGGEGAIYSILENENLVAKIYHQDRISEELADKILFMTKNPPDNDIMEQIAWPKDILVDNLGNFVGFIMPKLSIDTDLKAIYAYPPKIPITYQQKVIVAINICIVISAIHKAGYVFGDFNPLNIGINLTTGHVAFLDTDSYHITDRTSGKVYRCGVCLDGYVAPELIQHCKGTDFSNASLPTFTQETDRFALAIHIFKLLMNGYTPFNGIKEGDSVSQSSPGVGNLAVERDNYCFKPGNKPQSVATPDLNSMPPDIQYLFKKSFLSGAKDPAQRATADEWKQALVEYKEEELVQCTKNSAHFYYRSNSTCPYCDADSKYQQSLQVATIPSKSRQSQMSFSNPVNVPLTPKPAYVAKTPTPRTSAVSSRKHKRFSLGSIIFVLILSLIGFGVIKVYNFFHSWDVEFSNGVTYTKSEEWNNVTTEDLAIQITDTVYKPGVKVSDFIAKLEASDTNWKYKYDPEQLVASHGRVTLNIKSHLIECIEIEVINISDSALSLSDCLVMSINSNQEQVCRIIDGRSYEDITAMSYEDVLNLQFGPLKNNSTIEVDTNRITYEMNPCLIGNTTDTDYDLYGTYTYFFRLSEDHSKVESFYFTSSTTLEHVDFGEVNSLDDLSPEMLNTLQGWIKEKAIVEHKKLMDFLSIYKMVIEVDKKNQPILWQIYKVEINNEIKYLETSCEGLKLSRNGLNSDCIINIHELYTDGNLVPGWEDYPVYQK